MISEEDYEQLSKKIKPEIGDIIFARYASVGAVRYVDFTRKFLISYSCAIIKKGTKICSRYLYHFLNSDIAQKQIQLEINIGSQANIGIDSMKNNIFVTMPSWHEQENIATYLTNLDHLITLHQRKCDETKMLKKYMLQKMFPKDGKCVPEIRFSGYTDDWEQRKLGDVVERITRKNQDLVSTLPLTISAQYGLIDQNEFFDKRVASKDVSGYYLVNRGEFAYNKSTSSDAPWGAIKRLDRYENGVLSTLYIVFGIKDEGKVDSDYLVSYYDTNLWHRGVREIASEGARNHGLLNIAPADFFETSLMIPQDIEEQKKIGKCFERLNALITLHQRKCDELKKIKKFMLQNMFV
jgi:restriction endonuclease S subunit